MFTKRLLYQQKHLSQSDIRQKMCALIGNSQLNSQWHDITEISLKPISLIGKSKLDNLSKGLHRNFHPL